MDNNFFLNTGIPPSLHFEPSPSMPTWRSLSSAMDILPGDRNVSSAARSPESYYNSNWDNNKHSDHQGLNFESALSSMVSSPVASNSNNMSNESFVIRELIGKLGSIGSTSTNDIANNASCYSTPLNSPPKMKLTIVDPALNSSSVAEFSADPGFAERAAKFSCFGSRSFNGRASNQIGAAANSNSEVGFRSNQLTRVSSSPSLKALGSQTEQRSLQLPSSRGMECKSTLVSENQQTQMRETSMVPSSSTDLSSRKRKTASKAKAKDTIKVAEASDVSDLNAKRCKANENGNNSNNGFVKTEEDANKGCSSSDEKGKSDAKPPEPFKDYIHVRARRGQATDNHSLAERVRREKISERMKLLQDLVPGCNKVTGKALMLDEIINYVQSLQRQVEFLSMKLSSVNTRLDFNMDALMSKEIFQQQQSGSLPHTIFPSDSSAQSIYGHQQNPQHCSVDPLESALCQSLGMQLPSLNAYTESMPQFPAFGEDDLHTIVQMGFGQNPNKETEFPGSNQSSHMKIEL